MLLRGFTSRGPATSSGRVRGGRAEGVRGRGTGRTYAATQTLRPLNSAPPVLEERGFGGGAPDSGTGGVGRSRAPRGQRARAAAWIAVSTVGNAKRKPDSRSRLGRTR
ncbi:hypothetical protein GCM10023237_49410 [Streptomyces coeruleoprunus]